MMKINPVALQHLLYFVRWDTPPGTCHTAKGAAESLSAYIDEFVDPIKTVHCPQQAPAFEKPEEWHKWRLDVLQELKDSNRVFVGQGW